MKSIRLMSLMSAAAALAGCDALSNLLAPRDTTVRLINDGDARVTAQLYYIDQQDTPRDLLTAVGVHMEIVLEPGESRTIRRDCDKIQAIVIDDAKLSVVGDVGPTASSDVLRDGGAFDCGDTITFTFDHSAVLVDFDVSVAVDRN